MSNLFLFILLFSSSLSAGLSAGGGGGEKNPFTPKAFAMRYWDKAIQNTLPKPSFLISKASPLTAIEAAKYADLAATNALSTRLPEFCSAAHLLCFPDTATDKTSLAKHTGDGKFSVYNDGQNFTGYGTNSAGEFTSFKNYSDNGASETGMNGFRQYSRSSGGGSEKFLSYGNEANIVDQSFHTYGKNTGGGSGVFTRYTTDTNVPTLHFSSYSEGAAGREQEFTHYSNSANGGEQRFASYGKNSAGAKNDFKSYGNGSNVIASGFSNYGEGEAGPNDTFTNYGGHGNLPTQEFRNYAAGSDGGVETFKSYAVETSIHDDLFASYGKDSRKGVKVEFSTYGISFFGGRETFKGYAKNATGDPKVGFKEYDRTNNTFKDYNKKTVSFTGYTDTSSSGSSQRASGSLVNKWVEPGKFFREKMLKEGTIMPMPDIRDKMPVRSFLPRSISTKLSFSSSELKRMFKASDNSSMDKIIRDSLGECERAPSMGETKKCVGSLEDMVDFATSVLGHDITVRSTENVNGSKKNVMVGQIRGINGGKVTKSVSCHQSLFPYLLYYCHSVPKVRVYEADLLDPISKVKINHGVAICHLDTTAWSPTHGAFLALGSGPGRIEVCHWIFENDMTWTIAN